MSGKSRMLEKRVSSQGTELNPGKSSVWDHGNYI